MAKQRELQLIYPLKEIYILSIQNILVKLITDYCWNVIKFAESLICSFIATGLECKH